MPRGPSQPSIINTSFGLFFDVAIINSFILYQQVRAVGKMTLKEFRVELARQLTRSYNSRKYRERPSTHNTSSRRRKMHVPHYPTRARVDVIAVVLRVGQLHGTVMNAMPYR